MKGERNREVGKYSQNLIAFKPSLNQRSGHTKKIGLIKISTPTEHFNRLPPNKGEKEKEEVTMVANYCIRSLSKSQKLTSCWFE